MPLGQGHLMTCRAASHPTAEKTPPPRQVGTPVGILLLAPPASMCDGKNMHARKAHRLGRIYFGRIAQVLLETRRESGHGVNAGPRHRDLR